MINASNQLEVEVPNQIPSAPGKTYWDLLNSFESIFALTILTHPRVVGVCVVEFRVAEDRVVLVASVIKTKITFR